MEYKRYWTHEKCKEAALKYTNKRDFRLFDSCAYSASKKHKYINDICSHMIPLNNAHYRCIYSIEFIESNSVYIGLTYNMRERQMKRMNRSGDTVTIYINKTGYSPIYKQLTDYVNVELAIKLEEGYLIKYRNDGWNILNIAKTGGIGWTRKKHRYDDLEYVKSLVLEYKSVVDLMKKNNALYLKIKGNGWRDIIYPMLNYKKRYSTSFWTKENLVEFTKKFTNKKDFYLKHTCAHRICSKNGWLDEFYPKISTTI